MNEEEPLIGREKERAALLNGLRRAASGQGGVTLLGGETGAGKSALARFVLAQIKAETSSGLIVASGRCPEPGDGPSLAPWIEIVRRVGRRAANDASPLPRPLGEGRGAASAYELANALASWLGRGGLPLAILIEDFQWADAASIDVLRHLTAQLTDWPIRVICAYRTDELSRDHLLWGALPELQRLGAERVDLERFSQSDVLSLAERTLAGATTRPGGGQAPTRLTESIAALVYERTGGLPLFVREMLRCVEQSGELPRPGDPLPQSVLQAIDVKLRRLSRAAREALELAAVMGEAFSFSALAEVADATEDQLAEALDDAVAGRVIRSEPAGDVFVFDQAILREAILLGMDAGRRRRFSARVAAGVHGLTARQLEVIALVCEGLTDREIGDRLCISRKTVDRHLRNIFAKIGVGNRAALAAYAVRRGLGNFHGRREGPW